jgi:hypothetical protein
MEGDQDRGLFPAFHVAKDPPILFPFMINDSPVDQHQEQSYGDQHSRQQAFAESNQQVRGSQLFMCIYSVQARKAICL